MWVYLVSLSGLKSAAIGVGANPDRDGWPTLQTLLATPSHHSPPGAGGAWRRGVTHTHNHQSAAMEAEATSTERQTDRETDSQTGRQGTRERLERERMRGGKERKKEEVVRQWWCWAHEICECRTVNGVTITRGWMSHVTLRHLCS